MKHINISSEIIEVSDNIMAHKAFFYAHPEEGFKEKQTSQYITEQLKEMGYSVTENIAETGVLGIINGDGKSDECILIRAEMDALIVGAHEYKHVCGHDAHMAISLGVAQVISKYRERLKGSIKFLFQPAEEYSEGAKICVKQRVLENPDVTKILGIHVWSEFEKGKIIVCSDPIMASGGQFKIKICGKAVHGAMPHMGIDTIVIAAQFIQDLQVIVSRKINPMDIGIISIGLINGGVVDNILAEITSFSGTFRYFNSEVRDKFINEIEKLCRSYEAINGCKISFEYQEHVPVLANDDGIAEQVKACAIEIVGKDSVIEHYHTTCVDDFAVYLQYKKGLFILIGCRNEEYYPQHHVDYYVAKESLLIGADLLFRSIARYIM